MERSYLGANVSQFVQEVHTTIFVDQTIGEAIESIRLQTQDERIIYFYVIDREGHLVGIVSTRKLLLSAEQMKIQEVVDDRIIMILETEKLHAALHLMERHRLLAIPVVDKELIFKGIVDISVCLEETEESLDVVSTKKRMMMFQFLGFYLDEGKKKTVYENYRLRMPWITCNMIGGLTCAIISRIYAPVLSKALVLAMFIPLVLSLAESTAMQAMTQSIQEASRGFKMLRQVGAYLFKELRLFFLIALTCCLLIGGVSLLWNEGWLPSLTICFSIFISVIFSAIIGSSIPITLHALKWDPRVASGPIILMLADILTTTFYLALGTWWILG